MNGIVSSVSSNAFFNLLSFFVSLMEQKMSKLAEIDIPSFCFRKGRRFLESSGDSLSVFLGEDVPQDFPFAALKGLGWDILPQAKDSKSEGP